MSPAASLADLTASELAERFADGRATAVQATEAALERIAATDELLHAFLTVTGDQALADAREVDAARERGERLGRWPGSPWPSRTCWSPRGSGPPPGRGSWTSSCRPTTPPWSAGCATPGW